MTNVFKLSEMDCTRKDFSFFKKVTMKELGPDFRGLFAAEPVRAGEVIWLNRMKENSSIHDEITVHRDTILTWPAEKQEFFNTYCFQVGDQEYVGPECMEDVFNDLSYFFNHSCDPNCWIGTDNSLVARRDIAEGEEMKLDYATVENYFVAIRKCLCGSPLCRGKTTADDWKIQDLQIRYGNHWMQFFLKHLDAEFKKQVTHELNNNNTTTTNNNASDINNNNNSSKSEIESENVVDGDGGECKGVCESKKCKTSPMAADGDGEGEGDAQVVKRTKTSSSEEVKQLEYPEDSIVYSSLSNPKNNRALFGRGMYYTLHRFIELRDTPNMGGKGLFTLGLIPKGTVVWHDHDHWPEERYFTMDQIKQTDAATQALFASYRMQVDDHKFCGPTIDEEVERDASNFMNHSCEPNVWYVGEQTIAAMRDILPGEQICYDYGTSDAFQRFPECKCGANGCRKVLKGDDYRRRTFREKFQGHFSGYLTEKIAEEERNGTPLIEN